MGVTSFSVAASIPAKPGEELTCMTTGRRSARSKLTPQTCSPITCAVNTVVALSSGVSLTSTAEPPRCKFDLNSPSHLDVSLRQQHGHHQQDIEYQHHRLL